MKKTDSDHKHKSCRENILQYAATHYGAAPEYPWPKLPGYAVLRHGNNRKWYAIIMDVLPEKIGLSGSGYIDILDIKCDPVMSGSLLSQKGFLPAYHMHKGNWITILLDGSVEENLIFSLLDLSFDLTAGHQSRQHSNLHAQKTWIVPANPKYFDLREAFSKNETILWKQSSHISVQDTVYLYVAAPISAILYQCQVMETEIPYEYDDGKIHMDHVMKLKRLRQYDTDFLTLDKLKKHGVYAVRGPRHMPGSLLQEIEGEHK